MTKDELKALGLTDEQAEAIANDLGKNFVAKSQFNAKLEELKAAKAEKEAMGGELDKLRKANKDNEELAGQLDAIKKAAKEREAQYKADLDRIKLDSAVDMAVAAAKARNPKAVRALLDGSVLKLNEDGTVEGLEAQLKGLKESDSYLFESAMIDGLKPGDPGGKEPEGGADLAKQIEQALGM
ncbi:phage scaffolding protein [Acidaminococcus intestini]|uniref:phage scaffolding protein n=1 Tax=Acidaminococcus intestini TaxID=187327 RepID=UPI003AB33F26